MVECISKIGISLLVIAIFSFIQHLTNARKYRRIRQFPIVGLSILSVLGGAIWIIGNIENIKYESRLKGTFINADLLLDNTLIMVGFIVIGGLLKVICSLAFSNNKVLEKFSLSFYEYNNDYEEWFLLKRWAGFRKFLFGISCGLTIFSAIFVGANWILGPTYQTWFVYYPCAILCVINEIYNYINGQTKEEFEHFVIGDDSRSSRVSNYYKLREIFENILPEPLLIAQTGCDFTERETPVEILKKLRGSEDSVDQITAEYFDSDDRYKTSDVDCVQATLNLMHKKNVVFFNPFYKDLTTYITLPFIHTLLSGKNCLILCGRNSIANDVNEWISSLINDYCHMSTLWRVNSLSNKNPECEVGVISFTQIYDKDVLKTNRVFLENVGLVFLIEPSRMLNTSQVALCILADCMNEDEKPVYCVFDRYTDGLVDTLSHLLRSEITDVVAMPLPRCSYSAMSWNADGEFCREQLFDKQTKYLGDGVELGAIAVRNQVPSVTWYSETKSPIKDIKWISGQFHSTICKYMNLPCQQKSLYEKIYFISNLWSAPKTKEQFVIVEDEFCNLFSMIRTYLSRGIDQVFVNVLSESYLLRDYMRCNGRMFMSNPNAIPSFVPDYAKTERNTILKLIIEMSLRPVSEEEILKEFHLIGIETDSVNRVLVDLLRKYTLVDGETLFDADIETEKNGDSYITRTNYTVSKDEFEKNFELSLKNAYYILEDEKEMTGYIDAKMFSHVTQTVLPGQFLTYDGKYYQVKYVSPQSGVVLRRASDLYEGRKYYRQIRKYRLDFDTSYELVSCRKVMDIEFSEIRTDVYVDTTGYLETNTSHNLRTGRLVDLSNDPAVGNYSRKYHNKSVLKIKLPETDDKICFTICLLLSEIFKTLYPNGWPYLAALTRCREDVDGMLNYVVYPIEGDIEPGYIYLVEDSDVDLGLLSSVEKNFMRIMEIMEDFLDWNFEKLREPASKDPVPVKVSEAAKTEKKRRSLMTNLLDRIRKLFGVKKEEDATVESIDSIERKADRENLKNEQVNRSELSIGSDSEPSTDINLLKNDEESENDRSDTPIVPIIEDGLNQVDMTEESLQESKDSSILPDEEINNDLSDEEKDTTKNDFDPLDSEDPEIVAVDGTDIFDNDGMVDPDLEMCFKEIGIVPTESRYQRECYLKYGFEEIDASIQTEELRKYLRVRGWGNNKLTKARKGEIIPKSFVDTNTENCCDFCGLPLTGVSYDRLDDGRTRCNNCSSSAINSMDDFKGLYTRCLSFMQDFYGIKYKVPITVKVLDAKKLAKSTGRIFKPSKDYTERSLGYAQKLFGKYYVVLENGSPRLCAIDTIVHEMTHIWQYLNWKPKDVEQVYYMQDRRDFAIALDLVYEGMAVWSSIQYLYQVGESFYAGMLEALNENRKDVYGYGFQLYKEQYPISKDSSLVKYTPFNSLPPLEPEEVKRIVRILNPKEGL